jgi:hypothetical protein
MRWSAYTRHERPGGGWDGCTGSASQLFGVGATDPATFVTVALVLSGVALLATVIPAIRATHVDPAVTLRTD